MKKTTGIFILLSVVASAINYAAYPVLSRILPAAQYTDITVSLSILTQITTFLSSIVALTIGISKSYSHKEATLRIEKLQSLLFRLFVTLSVLFLIASPLLMPLIDTPAAYALPICIMMLGSIPITIISGYLNGKNLLIKLGLVAVVTASLQFSVGVITALSTMEGVWTMLLMGIAQAISIFILYKLFSREQLPSLRTVLAKLHFSSSTMRKLALYTLFASISIMVVNLLQVADLLVIKELHGVDTKLYTDIYVVSRVVFFAGMIFIWPFLGQLQLDNHSHNVKILLRLVGIFCAISLLAIFALLIGGQMVASVLFNSYYPADVISLTGALSIVYKLLLLIITAASLYMIVMRRYRVTIVAIASTLALLMATRMIGSGASINSALTVLDIAMAIATLLSLLLVMSDTSAEKIAKQESL
jgi:O-antigen/teichoic acid export membrane protein